MRLYMVRHGQTYANKEKYFYGEEEVDLTDKGREQARSIRPILANIKFDRVYSSDYLRAIETQRLALPGVEGIRNPWLREIAAGKLGGKPYAEVYDHPEIYGDWTPSKDESGYGPVGGETMEDVANRLRVFLTELEENPCDNVAAFVHNGVLGCMLRLVLGADSFKRIAASSANCAIHVFEYDSQKKMWKLLAWNYGVTLE